MTVMFPFAVFLAVALVFQFMCLLEVPPIDALHSPWQNLPYDWKIWFTLTKRNRLVLTGILSLHCL